MTYHDLVRVQRADEPPEQRVPWHGVTWYDVV